jgi:serine/threonine protein kinase
MMKQGPLSGQTLGGKYLLGELLGKGGFGAVYKAQNQMLRRQQAVKVLLEEHFSEEKFRDRFLREAQTLAALDHANIVHVDDIGIEGSLIYLVMPYISGGTLQDILKARPGPLSLEMVSRYLEQVCLALGYAHAQGIAHLDLKPLNLLVHQDGRLLLSDFGLAHLMERGAIEGGTSLQFGSPLYMAPEHFEGMPTQRSDLYALGVILYQMLTGRHPFEASTPAAIMRKHLTEPPPPLHLARPDLPVALDAVLAKALAKQQEQRYGRAGELLFDFRAALGGQMLQFASAAEQTRLSQVSLDPTQRAVNPPASSAGPTLAGVGPTVSPPISRPIAPQTPPPGFFATLPPRPSPVPVPSAPAPTMKQLWTPGFSLLFALVGAGALVLAIISIFSVNVSVSFNELGYAAYGLDAAQSNWIDLVLQIVLALAVLAALFSTKSRLVRSGLVAQLVAVVLEGIVSTLLFGTNGWFGVFDDSRFSIFHLVASCLMPVSLILISYGIARWKKSPDFGFSVLQVFLTGVVVVLSLLIGVAGGVSILGFVFLACVFLGFFVLVTRLAGWKRSPLVIACLAAGALFFTSHTPMGLLLYMGFSSDIHLSR